MRDTDEVAKAAGRMIAAVGKRLALDDPDSLYLLKQLEGEIAKATALAVEGMRANAHTDKAIGEALGMTRQAVQQRWPRTQRWWAPGPAKQPA